MSATLENLSHPDALATLRTAAAAGDQSPVTLLNLAIARDRTGDITGGRAMMQEIAAWLPGWDEPKLRLAESFRRQNRADEAIQAYAEVLEINPRREEALVARAVLLIQRNDPAAARSLLLRCAGINPLNPDAWDALGLALTMESDFRMAETAFAEASRLRPGNLDYALHCVEAAHKSGRIEQEVARLEAAVEADPLDGVRLTALSLALERAGKRRAAADMAEAATLLAPESAPTAILAGVLLARDNRLPEAERSLRQATSLAPDNPDACNDHAAVLMRMHRHAEARTRLTSLIERHGEASKVLCNLATAEVSLGLQQQGVATARRAIALDPRDAYGQRTLLNALPYQYGVTGGEMLTTAHTLSNLLPHPPSPDFALSPNADRRLRIGLLSGSLRTHPVGWLTIAGFENIDPKEFELVCLAQTTPTDPLARRFRTIASEWHDISPLDDAAAAALARERRIDILIDLGGYGDSGRMTACVHRGAPVQIKWVGMQNHSSGLPEMDWMIADRWQIPREHEPLYSERILRLPDGYVCYSPPPYAPDVGPLPTERNGYITFGCFNNLAKITPEAIQVWAAILRHLPESRLVLKTHQFSEAGPREFIHAAFENSRHRPGPNRTPWRFAAPRVHGSVQRHRPRAGPVPLLRRAHHLRGAVDGRSHGKRSRRYFLVPAFGQPSQQCRTAGLDCR